MLSTVSSGDSDAVAYCGPVRRSLFGRRSRWAGHISPNELLFGEVG